MALIGLLLATAVALRLVGGQEEQFPYELAIHFHQYSNPSQLLYDGTCCGFTCLTGCDTVLTLCIRIGGTSHDSLDCPSGLFVLGLIGGNNVAFTDAVGTMENPLVIPANILPPNGYQLLIQAFNFISRLSLIEPVDDVFIEIPASTLEEPSPPDIYFGEFHQVEPVAINLSYSLDCSPNYTLCTVNKVLQCVPESACINGSESLSAFMPQTALVFPDQSLDINIPIVPLSYTSMSHSFTSSIVLSATPSSSFSPNVATTAGDVPVAAIAGAVLVVLVFAAVIAILVVVGVAIAHHKKKKQPSPASEANTYMTYSELYRENSVHNSSQPTEHIGYEEIGDRVQGNAYEVVDPGQDPESTINNVANPMYRTTTLPARQELLYEEAQQDQDRSRSNTLTEVSNPMYGTTQTQGGEELEYQETQREVENDLYEDRLDADLDSKD